MTEETKLTPLELYATNYRDVPATLRNIAKGIEEGQYGDVKQVVVAIQGSTLDIFHSGEGDAESAHLLFSCAARKLENAVLDHYE